MTSRHDKSLVDHALDAFVYAPLGFLLEARDLLPKMAERGRGQVALTRLAGRVAAERGRAEADKIVGSARPPAPKPSPGAPAGTIIQMTRGDSSFPTTSAGEEAPTAPAATACSMASACRSVAMTWCPPRTSRSVMFAPILPSPTMASFMTNPPRTPRPTE